MNKLGFKSGILISAAALLCVLFAGLLYGLSFFCEKDLQKDFAECVKSSQIILKEHSEDDIKLLSLALDELCRDEQLKTLWRQHDRNVLNEYCQPLFRGFREKNSVTHFYFHEPDRKCFLRVHQPDRHSDVIQRDTLLQAQKTGSLAAGIELGPLGTLTLRVVQPWVIDGRVEGYLELGEEITEISNEISRVLDVGVAVLIEKQYLNRESWTTGMAMHDRSTNWDDLPNEIVVDCQSIALAPKDLSGISISSGDPSEKSMDLRLNGIPYLAGAATLFDYRGRNVGRMVIFENVAPQLATLHSLMFKLGVFFLLAAAAGLLGVYASLKHFEKLATKSARKALRALESNKIVQTRHSDKILQYRKALEFATDAIAIVSLERRIYYANQAFVKIFGYTKEEANSLGGTKNLYYDQKNGAKAYSAVSQGKDFSGEIEMVTKDNRTVQVCLRAYPITNNEGKIFGIVAIYTDLTEKRCLERQLLVQTKALVECNRALVEAKGVVVSFDDQAAN